jgi:hypothetical protein
MKLWSMKFLPLLIVLLASVARADDCKPIMEALGKQLYTSFGTRYHGTMWDKFGHCTGYAGFAHHSPGELTFGPYERAADAFPKVLACRALDTATISGEVVEHSYAAIEADAAKKLYTELWISQATGLVLKRSESTDDKTTTIEFNYRDVGFLGLLQPSPSKDNARPTSE